MKLLNWILAGATLAALGTQLTSCGGGGSSNPAQVFVDKLNALDAIYLYDLVKQNTQRGGGWIIVSRSETYQSCTDPADSTTCQTIPYNTNNFAVDLNDATRGSYSNNRTFFNGTSLGVGYNSSTHLYFDQYGNTYSKQGETVKDLNVLGAKADQVRREIYARELQSQYGLSVERSYALAKMGTDLQYLAKKNGGTVSEKDAAAFEQFAFGGVKVKNMIAHVQSGNFAAFNKDKEVIAKANGLSMEDVSFLITKFAQ